MKIGPWEVLVTEGDVVITNDPLANEFAQMKMREFSTTEAGDPVKRTLVALKGIADGADQPISTLDKSGD